MKSWDFGIPTNFDWHELTGGSSDDLAELWIGQIYRWLLYHELDVERNPTNEYINNYSRESASFSVCAGDLLPTWPTWRTQRPWMLSWWWAGNHFHGHATHLKQMCRMTYCVIDYWIWAGLPTHSYWVFHARPLTHGTVMQCHTPLAGCEGLSQWSANCKLNCPWGQRVVLEASVWQQGKWAKAPAGGQGWSSVAITLVRRQFCLSYWETAVLARGLVTRASFISTLGQAESGRMGRPNMGIHAIHVTAARWTFAERYVSSLQPIFGIVCFLVSLNLFERSCISLRCLTMLAIATQGYWEMDWQNMLCRIAIELSTFGRPFDPMCICLYNDKSCAFGPSPQEFCMILSPYLYTNTYM